MMTLSEKLEAAYDFWRPNRWGLKKYLLSDGKEHPFAASSFSDSVIILRPLPFLQLWLRDAP